MWYKTLQAAKALAEDDHDFLPLYLFASFWPVSNSSQATTLYIRVGNEWLPIRSKQGQGGKRWSRKSFYPA
jgi:hypothetical protein